MCLALAAFDNRIAALLETADRLVLIDLPAVDFSARKVVAVRNNSFANLVQLLQQNQVTVLICGAINGCRYRSLESLGVQVIPWITGNIDTVLAAFQNHTLEQCMMPGCRKGHRWGARGRHGWNEFNLRR